MHPILGTRPIRFAYSLPILLICASSLVRADVSGVSGSFTSQSIIGPNGSAGAGLQIQGAGFSLTSSDSCNSFVNFTPNGAGPLSFDPTVSVSRPPNCFRAGSTGQLVYQGRTYSNFAYTLNLVGRKVTVPDTNQFSNGGAYGEVSGVAFTMAGLVSVYADTSNTGPALFSFLISGAGLYSAVGYYEFGGGESAYVTYQFLSSPVGVMTDISTQGPWSGIYGGEGYMIANGASFQPSYAAVSVSGAETYTWAPTTNDPRALQNGRGSATSIASAYTSQSFKFNVYFTDNFLHRVSLYALDWDMAGRSETITISNANTGTVLDTEILTNFQNGEYISFNLSGNVTIMITSKDAANAAISGIFFGPGAAIDTYTGPIYASGLLFKSTDAATQGAWNGTYGLGGNLIAGEPSSGFTSGSVEPLGATTYIWAQQTTDPRALQSAPGSASRIASAFTQYPFTDFSFNIYGSPNMVSLYLLDWDNSGRSETITIKDLSSGAILNQQTVSNFQNGVYVRFTPFGDVTVQIHPVGSVSATVSGIFFN